MLEPGWQGMQASLAIAVAKSGIDVIVGIAPPVNDRFTSSATMMGLGLSPAYKQSSTCYDRNEYWQHY
jgi:hypothetical protein